MQHVVDILILDSSDDPYIYPPPGYYKIPVDLNRNAGGDFLYLAYARGDGADAIRSLYVSSQKTAEVQPPEGFQALETDLNKGAGGRYVYLYYSKRQDTGAPLTDLNVIGGPSSDPPVQDGWIRIPVDLNEDAGGDYLYLTYTRG